MSEEIDMIDSTKESNEWIKPVEGYEDYLITNNGMVWSRKRKKWMTLQKTDSGHLRINLKSWNLKIIHILVYQTFVRKLKKGEVIHHVNEIKTDNRLQNLTVMTINEHIRFHSTGRTAWNKGMERSQQTKAKISKANKGSKRSQQTKAKMRQAWARRKAKI